MTAPRSGSPDAFSSLVPLAAIVATLFASTLAAADGPASPLSPEQALAGLKTDPGLTVELAAAEPDVIDPVYIAFDPQGRLWVVQMGDYPNGPAPGEPGRSSIRVLTDEDGDGRFTNPVVFADGLLFANTLMFWQDGVLVTTDGRLDFMADRDGDGKADFRETWFEGFSRENPQLRANTPTLGHDGLIYVANGLRGGKVKAVRKEWGDHEPIDISGRDFAFDPFTGQARAVSGHGQFGMSFDDFGRRFVCSNRNPCVQVVVSERALDKNRDVAVTAVVADVAASGEASRIYPISRFWTTSNLHAGQFTAACGLHVFRGDGLGSAYYGNALTCDPTGNLVHREVLSGEGVVFQGRSPYDKREFLASEDTWFRPVNLATGPDGSLYIADMYRAVIEHPQFMPEELKTRPDLLLGTDRGRVYRVKSAAAARPKEPAPKLHETATSDLIPLLEHPNAWQRETAFRLLVERQDRAAATTILQLLPSASPRALTLMLWSLNSLGSITADQLLTVVQSTKDADVLEECLHLANLLDAKNGTDSAATAAKLIAEKSGSLSGRLRYHVALNLAPADFKVTARLCRQQLDDPWLRTAALLSSKESAVEVFSELVESAEPRDVASLLEFGSRLMQSVAARGVRDEIGEALMATGHLAGVDGARRLEVESTLWTALAAALRSRGKSPTLMLEAAASAGIDMATEFNEAIRIAGADESPLKSRLTAVRLLELETFDRAQPPLQACLQSADSTIVSAAVSALAALSDPRVGPLLLENYSSRSPSVRREIQTAIFRSEPRIAALLDEVDAGRIAATEIDSARMQQLARVKDPQLKERGTKLIAANRPADRAEVIERYQPALARKGDPAHGRELFSKNCAQCHRIGEIGVNVAPDISDSRVKLPSQLLTDILDPNRAIDNNYFSYVVVDRDGAIHTGVIATETATSITLRQPEDKRVTIARDNIEQLKSTGQSLMPVGLEKALSVEEMSDLISFIKNWRYLQGCL
ncbi:MAG TPA: PVC-type heme-binding CxxCH protein, partial [Caulifigura sp.]|nr:PVC-type heme-binding CxxCH protein [Caulifigura sp.]